MRNLTYLNVVLTIIALNLSLLTLSMLDLVPQAKADKQVAAQQQLRAPVNEDGSIDVRLQPSDELDVTIEDVESNAFSYTDIPVEIQDQTVEVEQY
jgi:biopolymer transport protein ExbD